MLEEKKPQQHVDVTREGEVRRNNLEIWWEKEGDVTSLAGTDVPEVLQVFCCCQ